MLKKLGGKDILQKATDIFYDRQLADPKLARFFRGSEITILKWHQFNLMGTRVSWLNNMWFFCFFLCILIIPTTEIFRLSFSATIPTTPGIAFTALPDNFDVEKLILVRHQHLFDRGLDETYFDHTVEIFVETLRELKVDPELVDEAKAVIHPLRKYFEEGAELARQRQKKTSQEQAMRQVGLMVVVATVALFSIQTLRHRKK
jgi:truncated hemoglobin YjbI